MARFVWQWSKTKEIWVDMDDDTSNQLENHYCDDEQIGQFPTITVQVKAVYGRKRGAFLPMIVDFHNMVQTIDIRRPIRRIKILADSTGYDGHWPGSSPH